MGCSSCSTTEYNKSQEEIRNLQLKIKVLEEDKNTMMNIMKDMETKNTNLEEDIKKIQMEFQELIQEKRKNDQEKKMSNNKIGELEERNKILEQELKERKIELNEMIKERMNINEEQVLIQKNKEELEENNKKLKENLIEIQRQYDEIIKEKRKIEEKQKINMENKVDLEKKVRNSDYKDNNSEHSKEEKKEHNEEKTKVNIEKNNIKNKKGKKDIKLNFINFMKNIKIKNNIKLNAINNEEKEKNQIITKYKENINSETEKNENTQNHIKNDTKNNIINNDKKIIDINNLSNNEEIEEKIGIENEVINKDNNFNLINTFNTNISNKNSTPKDIILYKKNENIKKLNTNIKNRKFIISQQKINSKNILKKNDIHKKLDTNYITKSLGNNNNNKDNKITNNKDNNKDKYNNKDIELENKNINIKIDKKNNIENINDIISKQNNFISNFFKDKIPDNIPNPNSKSGIFMKNRKKLIKISSKKLEINDEFILTVINTGERYYYHKFHYNLDSKNSDKINIKIDNKIINVEEFEKNEKMIKLEFEKLYNGQSLDIKINYEYENENNKDYFSLSLHMKSIGYTKFLIYAIDNIKIDKITNNSFVFENNLNLCYFEGKIDEKINGAVYFSRKFYFEIYDYIPEFKEKEEEIIKNKEKNKKAKRNILSRYKLMEICDDGSIIEDIYKFKISNYKNDIYMKSFTYTFIKNTEFKIEFFKLNGKEIKYAKFNDYIKIEPFGAYDNQYAEIHIKYKYKYNKINDFYRQESFHSRNSKDTYVNYLIKFPQKYICIKTNEIFTKDILFNNNQLYYKGIGTEDEIKEKITLTLRKYTWNINKEFILFQEKNFSFLNFKTRRIFKGGNLKEKSYEIIKNNVDKFKEDEENDTFIFNYKNLDSNKVNIILKLYVENSTSDYIYKFGDKFITKIPEEDKDFFKNLCENIIKQNKENFPIHKIIGKWVHNYLKYDLSFHGKKMSAKEIYKKKAGVCEHYTILYNTLLIANGIDAVAVSGISLLKIDEIEKNNNEKDEENISEESDNDENIDNNNIKKNNKIKNNKNFIEIKDKNADWDKNYENFNNDGFIELKKNEGGHA